MGGPQGDQGLEGITGPSGQTGLQGDPGITGVGFLSPDPSAHYDFGSYVGEITEP